VHGLVGTRDGGLHQHAAGTTYHGTVTLATRLRRAGFCPVPHVAARRIASRDALDEYLARAAGEAG